jgi:single-strand DNA-binding protein
LNSCSFIGRLGKDAEVRHTQSGVAVVNFTIACGEKYKDQSGQLQEKTEWVNCVAWKKEKLAPYLTKGTQLYVRGKMQTRKWQDASGQDRYSTEINVFEIELLGGGKSQAQQAPKQQAQQQAPQQQAGGFPTSTEQMDDAPF